MSEKISFEDEHRMTRAIEKAATIANIRPELDRNELLVSQLKSEKVDPKFSKVAGEAFNKRLTVVTLSKTADDHKADSFDLCDPNLVSSMMGDTTQLAKTASTVSAAPAFKINFTMAQAPVLQKSATITDKAHACYEDTVNLDTLIEHIQSMMDKHAAAFSVLSGTLDSLEYSIQDQRNKLQKILNKTANTDAVIRTLVSYYGKPAIVDMLGTDAYIDDNITKQASIILPDTGLYKAAKRLKSDIDTFKIGDSVLQQYAEGLTELSKAATEFDKAVESVKFSKTAANPLPTIIGTGMHASMMTAGLLGNTLADARDTISDSATSHLQNAMNMYDKGVHINVAPGEVLDADFLSNDRLHDRMLSWSDMSADPQFAAYPSEQVFLATQKAMDIDPALERRDKREMLRAQVGQLLAQNNRLSTADIAALGAYLKSIKDSKGSAQVANERVAELDDKHGPEAPLAELLAGIKLKNDYRVAYSPDNSLGQIKEITKDYVSALREEEKARSDVKQKDKEVQQTEENKDKEAARLLNTSRSTRQDISYQKKLMLADMLSAHHSKYHRAASDKERAAMQRDIDWFLKDPNKKGK